MGENKLVKSKDKSKKKRIFSKRRKYSRTSDYAGEEIIKLVALLGKLDDFIRPSAVAINHCSPGGSNNSDRDYLDGDIRNAKNAALPPRLHYGSAAEGYRGESGVDDNFSAPNLMQSDG
jgi:hypothetical protein